VAELTAVVEPFYPKISDAGGRPPLPLERMLRVYFLRWGSTCRNRRSRKRCTNRFRCATSPASIWESNGARRDNGMQVLPSVEKNKLGKKLLTTVNDHLRRSGIKITTGTIVDATIIGTPSWTKNKDGKRGPEMHQTAKGKQWYFGMKVHIGVDSRTKLVHTVLAFAANVADCLALQYLLHGKERRVSGDQAYRGLKPAIRAGAPRATKDFTNQRYRWGKRIDESVKATNRRKSSLALRSSTCLG
jgi:IS5 family transposase